MADKTCIALFDYKGEGQCPRRDAHLNYFLLFLERDTALNLLRTIVAERSVQQPGSASALCQAFIFAESCYCAAVTSHRVRHDCTPAASPDACTGYVLSVVRPVHDGITAATSSTAVIQEKPSDRPNAALSPRTCPTLPTAPGKEQLSFSQGAVINLKKVPPGEGWAFGELNGTVGCSSGFRIRRRLRRRLFFSAVQVFVACAYYVHADCWIDRS